MKRDRELEGKKGDRISSRPCLYNAHPAGQDHLGKIFKVQPWHHSSVTGTDSAAGAFLIAPLPAWFQTHEVCAKAMVKALETVPWVAQSSAQTALTATICCSF